MPPPAPKVAVGWDGGMGGGEQRVSEAHQACDFERQWKRAAKRLCRVGVRAWLAEGGNVWRDAGLERRPSLPPRLQAPDASTGWLAFGSSLACAQLASLLFWLDAVACGRCDCCQSAIAPSIAGARRCCRSVFHQRAAGRGPTGCRPAQSADFTSRSLRARPSLRARTLLPPSHHPPGPMGPCLSVARVAAGFLLASGPAWLNDGGRQCYVVAG